MKKIFITLFILFLTEQCAFCTDKVHVKSLSDFDSQAPHKTLQVQLLDDTDIDNILLNKDSIINLSVNKIIPPKRAKQDAKIFFNVLNYEHDKSPCDFNSILIAQYAKTALNKKEIKEMPKKNIVLSAAGTVGNHFFKGISYGMYFVDGIVENKEGNRLKSGAKELYDKSFLSIKDYGKYIDIKKDDNFYLIIKQVNSSSDKDIQSTEEK